MKTLVIIPTYNEIESLPRQVSGVRLAAPEVHILVVDDGSPDGTGDWADAFANTDDHVFVMHRQSKQGLGVAYRAGFAWALERNYEVVVEMDADGSHRAQDLPLLLAKAGDHDLVIGSRWVPGGAVENWPLPSQVAVDKRQPLRAIGAWNRRQGCHSGVQGISRRNVASTRLGCGRIPGLLLPGGHDVADAAWRVATSSRCRSRLLSGTSEPQR